DTERHVRASLHSLVAESRARRVDLYNEQWQLHRLPTVVLTDSDRCDDDIGRQQVLPPSVLARSVRLAEFVRRHVWLEYEREQQCDALMPTGWLRCHQQHP